MKSTPRGIRAIARQRQPSLFFDCGMVRAPLRAMFSDRFRANRHRRTGNDASIHEMLERPLILATRRARNSRSLHIRLSQTGVKPLFQ